MYEKKEIHKIALKSKMHANHPYPKLIGRGHINVTLLSPFLEHLSKPTASAAEGA